MKSVAKAELFRELPSVDEVVRASALLPLVEAHGATAVTDAARSVLARLRESHPDIDVDADSIFVRDGAVWTSAGVTFRILSMRVSIWRWRWRRRGGARPGCEAWRAPTSGELRRSSSTWLASSPTSGVRF